MLDNIKSTSEILTVERMILEIDSKIINAYSKTSSTELRSYRKGIDFMNQHMEREKSNKRYVSVFDVVTVSLKAKERIYKIIKEDRERL